MNPNKFSARTTQAQAAIEFLLALMVLIPLIVGALFAFQILLWRLKALDLAQVGTDLLASGLVTNDTVKSKLEEFLSGGETVGAWSVETARFLETPAARFYNFSATHIRRTNTSVLSWWPNSPSIDEKVVAQKESQDE